MMLLRQTLSTAAALVTVAVVGNSRLIADSGHGCGPFVIGECHYWYAARGPASTCSTYQVRVTPGCHTNTQYGLCNVHNPAVGCY